MHQKHIHSSRLSIQYCRPNGIPVIDFYDVKLFAETKQDEEKNTEIIMHLIALNAAARVPMKLAQPKRNEMVPLFCGSTVCICTVRCSTLVIIASILAKWLIQIRSTLNRDHIHCYALLSIDSKSHTTWNGRAIISNDFIAVLIESMYYTEASVVGPFFILLLRFDRPIVVLHGQNRQWQCT